MPNQTRGYTGREINHNGAVIREFIIGYAYPRNGNVHNPTAQRCWHIFVNGVYVDRANFMREARTQIDEMVQA
jgi:hypothetical protein